MKDQSHKGKVKTLTEKGFGFITIPGSKKDMFFHVRNLQGITYEDLQLGDELVFNVEEGERGPYAVDIERA